MKSTGLGSVAQTNEPTWSVWRKDDHGNAFLVKSGLTEADALRLVKEYQSKGHKQTYWADTGLKKPVLMTETLRLSTAVDG